MSEAADTGSMLQRAQRAYHDGRMGVVESECRRILDSAPENAEAWVLMATVARHYGRLEDATEMMRRAVQLKPGNPHMKEVLASIYVSRRDWRNAEALYEGLLGDGTEPRFLNALGKCAWGTGRYETALERFSQAARHGPDDPATQVGLAQAHISMWRFDDAARVLGQFVRRAPGHATPWMLLAKLQFEDGEPDKALEMIRIAAGCEDANALVHMHQAAMETLAGNSRAARDCRHRVPEGARFEAFWEGFEYGLSNRPPARFEGVNDRVLRTAVSAVGKRGLNLEFGVFHGRTIRHLASCLDSEVHGFDSFHGLPEDWSARERAGSYSTGGRRPKVPSNVTLHEGWFEDTLPVFMERHRQPVRFAHIDCDLYSSTRTVLDHLLPRLQPGSILVFDDYVGYPGWRDHEYKAFQEIVAEAGLQYRYLGFTLLDRSAAVEITRA